MIPFKDIIHIQMPEPDYGPFPKWIETYKTYPTTKQLFPCWITAEIMLKTLADGCEIYFDQGESPTWKYNFLLIIPGAFDMVSGKYVPITEGFPPEDKALVNEILMKTMYDYLPPLKTYDGMPLTESTQENLMQGVRKREAYIKTCGGYDFRKELKLRFGMWGCLL